MRSIRTVNLISVSNHTAFELIELTKREGGGCRQDIEQRYKLHDAQPSYVPVQL